jgi:anti-anti-sigma factor
MHLRRTLHDDCLVLRAVGVLDLSAVPALREDVLKAVVEQPRAVILDLTDLTALDARCTSIFDAVARQACEWPGTVLALCGAHDAVARTLARSGAPRFLALFEDVDEALRRAREQPPRQRREAQLPADPTAARQARHMVRDLCDRWQLEDLRDTAMLVVSELVANTIRYAGSPPRLRVELGPRTLTVAVGDDCPDLPRRPAATSDLEGGRGLFIVEQLAVAWGVHQHAGDGKTVWCALRR